MSELGAELTEEKIQEIILEILSGERLIRQNTYNNSKELPSIVKLSYPSAADRQLCDILEEVSLEQSIQDGLPSENDLEEVMYEAFFSVEDLEKLHDLQEKKKGYESLLKKRVKGTDIYLKNQEKLREIEHEVLKLERKRQQVSEYTAEYQAKEDKYFELLARSAYHLEGYRVWENAEHLLRSTDTNYAYSILNKFLDFYWGYSTKIIRRVARSPQWRTMYLASEKGSRLTDICAKDLPISYLHLMSWSMYYQSIQEMLPSERPTQDIIEDDEKLDKFMQEYQIKVKKEAEKVRKDSGRGKRNPSSALDKDQVVVTAESNNYVKLHKDDGYSDTAVISGRVGEDGGGDTTYSEVREKRVKMRERASKRRNRLKNKGIQ